MRATYEKVCEMICCYATVCEEISSSEEDINQQFDNFFLLGDHGWTKNEWVRERSKRKDDTSIFNYVPEEQHSWQL
jgi:hypothetical protein